MSARASLVIQGQTTVMYTASSLCPDLTMLEVVTVPLHGSGLAGVVALHRYVRSPSPGPTSTHAYCW